MDRVSTQTAPAGISAREAEILTLVGGAPQQRRDRGAAVHLGAHGRDHVSSLLRKLGVPDRRALADLAAELAQAERTSQALAGLLRA